MARPAPEADKHYKIGEVCKLADLQPYVLRYWETEFPQLSPGKSGGGQRLYTQAEVDTILRIKELLYRDGFTIAGAKKKLEADLVAPAVLAGDPVPVSATPQATAPGPELSKTLKGVQRELRAILSILEE